MSRVIVVGGGLGGAAAAIRLAHAGCRVALLEKNGHLGGKMNVLRERGFLFDMGPTILTMPQALDRLFAAVGRRREDYIDLVRLDPQWRAFFEDGATLDVWGDPQRMIGEIRRFSPEDADGYPRFRDYAQRMYEFSDRFFFWRNIGGVMDILKAGDFLNAGGLSTIRGLDLFSTVGGVVNRYFRDPRLRQVLEHFMQYVGSSPHRTPAILTAIHHIQLEFGVWYPMGGTNRVAAALARLAEEVGVELCFGATVDRLVTHNRRVTGVEAGGRVYEADAVVANSDFVRTHREMLPSTATGRDIAESPRRYEPTCSGMVFYFGLDRKYENLAHHDFFFSKDPAEEFRDIYDRGVPAWDPTLCVCAPSRTDPSAAPAGCENVYVLVHTPYLRPEERWDEWIQPYRDLVVEKLERCGLKDFRRHIRVEHRITPRDLDSLYRVDRGAIYGITSHGRLRGGFKPANRSRDFENLYFCGGSVNPGPGVPMALMSGQIAAECAMEDLASESLGARSREETIRA